MNWFRRTISLLRPLDKYYLFTSSFSLSNSKNQTKQTESINQTKTTQFLVDIF